MLNKLFMSLFISAFSLSSYALSSDREQPASITADNVEYDFNTGERLYEGNVVLIQGTLRVDADKLIVQFDGDELREAIATGKRAKFKQRPDGKDSDVIGIGNKLILNQKDNMMEIIGNAELEQGKQKANGAHITYNMSNDKMNIIGAASGGQSKVVHESEKKKNVAKEKGRSSLKITQKERKDNQQEETEASEETPTE